MGQNDQLEVRVTGQQVVVTLDGGSMIKGRALERVGDLASLRGRRLVLVHATVTNGAAQHRVERIEVDGSAVRSICVGGK